jgi:hypothetical protein
MGGVALGLLSAIPFVSLPNICCCAWAIAGGLMATYLYVKNSTVPARPGDGAILGAIAGVVGAVIYVILGPPLNIMTGNAMLGIMVGLMERFNPDMAGAMATQAEMMQSMPFVQQWIAALPGALFGALMLVIFATVGGLLGVPIFEKRKPDANLPPPPPSGFGGGGQPGGGTYGGYGS